MLGSSLCICSEIVPFDANEPHCKNSPSHKGQRCVSVSNTPVNVQQKLCGTTHPNYTFDVWLVAQNLTNNVRNSMLSIATCNIIPVGLQSEVETANFMGMLAV